MPGHRPSRTHFAVKMGLLTALLVLTVGLVTADEPGAEPAPFAVVELFTSEGCSSCPPAERLLNEIVAEAQRDGTRVFPLAFHVDYWDRLGWKDPYSNPAYSARQRDYAEAFQNRTVYTPQMVVNGKHGFVGSDRAQADRAIDSALRQPASTVIRIQTGKVSDEQGDPQSIALEYAIEGSIEGSVLNLAAVERGLVTDVPRGENAGRRLEHDNVVRAYRTVPLDNGTKGTATLKLPDSVDPRQTTIIAYTQDPRSMTIHGATLLNLE